METGLGSHIRKWLRAWLLMQYRGGGAGIRKWIEFVTDSSVGEGCGSCGRVKAGSGLRRG